MKSFNYLRLSLLFTLLLSISFSTYAQKDAFKEKLSYLTAEQKQLLKEQQKLLDDTRAVFKQTLTKEQFALINNSAINKQERTELLKKTLTSGQLSMISANRKLIRSKKNMFRRSLTQKQRMKLRRFIKKRPSSDRKRLVRRLRRLIQNNMD